MKRWDSSWTANGKGIRVRIGRYYDRNIGIEVRKLSFYQWSIIVQGVKRLVGLHDI
jgi:hypothetical protein